jgi:hypothetical protein
VKDDGYHDPNIRVLVRPILNLFHGDRGGKKWKNAVDGALKAGGLSSFSDLMDKTLGQIPDEILDAPPRSSHEAALILGNGVLHQCFDALPEVLAQPGDRARGENERRRGGSPSRKEKKREQQQHQVDAAAAAAAAAAEQQRRQQELLAGGCCGCGDELSAEAADGGAAVAAADAGREQSDSLGGSSEVQAATEQQQTVVAAVGA